MHIVDKLAPLFGLTDPLALALAHVHHGTGRLWLMPSVLFGSIGALALMAGLSPWRIRERTDGTLRALGVGFLLLGPAFATLDAVIVLRTAPAQAMAIRAILAIPGHTVRVAQDVVVLEAPVASRDTQEVLFGQVVRRPLGSTHQDVRLTITEARAASATLARSARAGGAALATALASR